MKKETKIQLCIFTLLLVFIFLNGFYKSLTLQVIEIPEFNIPYRVGAWSGRDLFINPDALNLIRPDNYIMREYSSKGVPSVVVYMGHYRSLDNSDSAHSPLVCYPGSGWIIKDSKDISFVLNGEEVGFTQMSVQKDDQVDVVLFGYRHSKITSSAISKIRLKQFYSHILQKRSDSAFIRFSTNLKNRDMKSTQRLLESFLVEFYPHLDSFFVNKE